MPAPAPVPPPPPSVRPAELGVDAAIRSRGTGADVDDEGFGAPRTRPGLEKLSPLGLSEELEQRLPMALAAAVVVMVVVGRIVVVRCQMGRTKWARLRRSTGFGPQAVNSWDRISTLCRRDVSNEGVFVCEALSMSYVQHEQRRLSCSLLVWTLR